MSPHDELAPLALLLNGALLLTGAFVASSLAVVDHAA